MLQGKTCVVKGIYPTKIHTSIVEIARRREYITDQDKTELRKAAAEIAKMLYGLSRSLDRKK